MINSFTAENRRVSRGERKELRFLCGPLLLFSLCPSALKIDNKEFNCRELQSFTPGEGFVIRKEAQRTLVIYLKPIPKQH